jgi:probable F420-dependent oxidoreductase
MLVETNLREVPLRELPAEGRLAEALGFDGLTASEIRRDPFIAIALIASATERVQLATSVAIAFPRSPMLVAYQTRNLQDLSAGRFSVGLGTQVRGHVERRFSAVFGKPGPHLKEYVESLRAIWRCWQEGAPLDYQGAYYRFSLMTPEFSLGESPYPTRIHLAAVNPYNVALAATHADALRVHAFCTPEYLRDVIWPHAREAAVAAGRELDEFEMIGCGFIATGADEDAVGAAREEARRRVAFYGSTPSYRAVFEHHGWNDLGPALRRLIAAGRWQDMPGLISDEVLNGFCFAATYDRIADVVERRLGGLVDRLAMPFPSDAADGSERLRGALRDLQQIPTARQSAANRCSSS